ncbi:MAG TPA: VWA domain-containing protein [Treponemataceae bacterium]|nr:MAG: von Willebrand factor type A domain protein [Spirochaetes bacterium ADurb.Bin215]HPA10178.1 VWA domain-containing protein [Treponemataceae bacterium]
MRNVKRFIAVIVLLCASCVLFASGADIVVLMDASGTILPWFDQVNSRILPDITRKFVRQGDTFHLISFNSRVNLEIVQPVQNEQDVSRVVSRFMLLYPLGQNSDFLSGLNYTHQYVSSLPERENKIVIIISDGIFNPPENSRYAGMSPADAQTELSSLARRIRSAGWEVYYIKLPFPENAVIRSLDDTILADTSAGHPDGETREYLDVSSEFTEQMDIRPSEFIGEDVPVDFVDSVFSLPEVEFPQDIGKKGHYFVLPLKVTNVSDQTVHLELTGVVHDSINVLDSTEFLRLKPGKKGTLRAHIQLPETLPLGKQSVPLSLRFSGNVRTVPQSAYVTLELVSFSIRQSLHRGGPVAYALILVLFAVLIVALVLFLIARRTSGPAAAALRTAGTRDAESSGMENAAFASGENRDKNIAYTTGENRDKHLAYTTGENHDKNISFELEHDNSTATLAAQASELEKARRERYSILSGAAPVHAARLEHRQGARAGEAIAVREDRSIMLNLFVTNQNTAIGRRNVHRMKAGSRLSLGGGASAFLVFLVHFPSRIAEVRFDGVQCTLAILKPEFFPYEEEVIIENCIDREFTLVSDHGYEVSFTLREFEDPVERLNRLLTSIHY